jgi:hypothetical protein
MRLCSKYYKYADHLFLSVTLSWSVVWRVEMSEGSHGEGERILGWEGGGGLFLKGLCNDLTF